MFSALKAAWSRLAGTAGATPDGPPLPAIDYKGYRIRPAPYLNGRQYQTAGSIEKDTPEGLKEHKFIRADTYASLDDAITFTIAKAKQIIDQQSDRIFS